MASDSVPIYPQLDNSFALQQDYRLKKIADVQTAIETELAHYERVLKKYKRAHSGLSRCSLFSGSLTVLLSGLATARRMERKILKHERTVELAKCKLSTVVDLISKALNDGKVSHKECSFINAELDKFRRLKAEIRAPEARQDAREEPRQEAQQEVEERV